MEEKKRRPRVIKPIEGSLEERFDQQNENDQTSERSPSQEMREGSEERTNRTTDQPEGYQQRRPWQDRNEQSGGGDSGYPQRRPWQDRSQSGGTDGGYQQRRPYQDRSQSGGDGGYQQRRPWQDRNEQSGGDGGYQQRRPWQDRSQSGGDGGYQQRRPYQDRSQGGGTDGGYQQRKPWQDRPQGGGTDGGYQQRRPWQDRNEQGGGTDGGYQQRKPWQDRSQSGGTDGGYQQRRPWQDRNEQSGGGDGGYQQRRPWQDRNEQGGGDGGYQQRKPWQDRNEQGGGDGGYQQRRPYQDRSQSGGDGGYQQRRPWQDRNEQGGRDGGYQQRPWQDRSQGGGNDGGYQQRRPYGGGGNRGGFNARPGRPFKKKRDDFYVEPLPKPDLPSGEGMPLNKYLAHCGLSSRRKAVEYIESGRVTVNGKVVTEPYYRYQLTDEVICDGNKMTIQERQIYVLLNKPKGVITTTDDEHGRNTVMDIVDPHYPERIYPVGRLDRDTTGLILLTNDGDLAQKLSHPSHHVHKQYRVRLDQGLTREDHDLILKGIELEDGKVEVSWIRFAEDHPQQDVIEIEITMGRNRVVRRIFESLGYQVQRLDRFYYAGLTKKDLQRGSFRELTQREIIMLKHFTGHPSTVSQKPFDPDLPNEEEHEDATDNDFDAEDDN